MDKEPISLARSVEERDFAVAGDIDILRPFEPASPGVALAEGTVGIDRIDRHAFLGYPAAAP